MSQGKSKTMPMQIFWGVEAVYYGIVQVENQNPALWPTSPLAGLTLIGALRLMSLTLAG